jgi:hypothetical protein
MNDVWQFWLILCAIYAEMRKLVLLLLLVTTGISRIHAQRSTALTVDAWVDSVFRTLSPDEKITQLMVIRLSGIDPATHRALFYDSIAEDAVRKYNVGGVSALFRVTRLPRRGGSIIYKVSPGRRSCSVSMPRTDWECVWTVSRVFPAR